MAKFSGNKVNVNVNSIDLEAKRLFSQPKSRESMIQNALIPRMTRSGKIFDGRRYSTVNHLANLAIKEEDEDDENLVSITSQQKEDVESIENGTSDAEFRPGASIVEECRCYENFREEQGLVEKETSQDEDNTVLKSVERITGNAAQSQHCEQNASLLEDKTNAECTGIPPPDVIDVSESIEQQNDQNVIENSPSSSTSISTGLSGNPLHIESGSANVNTKRRARNIAQKKREKKRRGKPVQEVHLTLASPPKISCPNNLTEYNGNSHTKSDEKNNPKTVHWADEQENVELSEVREFKEDKPRRRCTMFHKVNG